MHTEHLLLNLNWKKFQAQVVAVNYYKVQILVTQLRDKVCQELYSPDRIQPLVLSLTLRLLPGNVCESVC